MVKYIFCGVSFSEYGDEYQYISNVSSVKPGDFVIVPTGKDNKERIARVEKVQSYSSWTAPYPVNKTKHIIRICTEQDKEKYGKDYLTYPENSLRAIYKNYINGK